MKVSKVEIVAVRPSQGLVGFASVELDGQLLLNSIGIHSRRDGQGYRLTYPTRTGGGDAINVFHPINQDLSKEIEAQVFARAHKIFD